LFKVGFCTDFDFGFDKFINQSSQVPVGKRNKKHERGAFL
jgi:hypothetical protein